METDFYSQLAFRLEAFETSVEETMYFSLASSVINETMQLNELPLPNFLLAEVKQVVLSPLYFEYNGSTKQKVLGNFRRYANSYSLIKLTASWEEFMLQFITVMEMAKTDDYGSINQTTIRKNLKESRTSKRSGTNLLKDLDRLYQLNIVQSLEFQVIDSVYKLRDCIAHRNGVISAWDLDKNSNFMSTVWKKAIVKRNKQSLSAWTLAGKTRFRSVREYEKKQWVKDQVITLEEIEICDIGLSLVEIGNIIFQKLVDYGKAHRFR